MTDSTRDPAEVAAWLRLTATPGVSALAGRRLLAKFGLPQTVLAQNLASLREVVDAKVACVLNAPPDAAMSALIDRTVAWLADARHAMVTMADAGYPAGLLDLADPPCCSISMETLPVWPAQRLAWSARARRQRKARAMPRRLHRRFPMPDGQWCPALRSASTPQPTPGHLRAGRHRGSDRDGRRHRLPGQASCAGTSDRRRGRCHRQRVCTGHARVAEPLSAPQPYHCGPVSRRAGGGSGGAVGFADHGAAGVRDRREVFAMPGSIHAELARGCHKLIRQGAKLVETPADVFEEFGDPGGRLQSPGTRTRFGASAR
jgi:DNA processing protein